MKEKSLLSLHMICARCTGTSSLSPESILTRIWGRGGLVALAVDESWYLALKASSASAKSLSHPVYNSLNMTDFILVWGVLVVGDEGASSQKGYKGVLEERGMRWGGVTMLKRKALLLGTSCLGGWAFSCLGPAAALGHPQTPLSTALQLQGCAFGGWVLVQLHDARVHWVHGHDFREPPVFHSSWDPQHCGLGVGCESPGTCWKRHTERPERVHI